MRIFRRVPERFVTPASEKELINAALNVDFPTTQYEKLRQKYESEHNVFLAENAIPSRRRPPPTQILETKTEDPIDLTNV